MTRRWIWIAMFGLVAGCTDDDSCIDEDGAPVACEHLEDVPEVADTPVLPEPDVGADAPADFSPGPDDLDGLGDEAIAAPLAAGDHSGASAAIDFGRTDHAERRKFLPIGRTPGARRYVVMRLRPSDLPSLAAGDTLLAASELQVTTRCDIGQVAPGCGYSPHIALQLLLSGDPQATDPRGHGTLALSDVKKLECTKDEHHCVPVIDFSAARATLDHAAPGCVASSSCFVNLVAWAYHSDARSGGQDRLLLGANEGDFLQNGDIEQDRGRIMAVRERDLTGVDVSMRVTAHDVKSGPIQLASNGNEVRIYSHTLNGGHDLEAGESYRIWTDVDASSNGRVNLSLELFLTKNRLDHNGGGIADTSPKQISEHNGTNCSPGNDCHLRKVAVFAVDRRIAGPVYVNIAASTEVPGPGSATTTIHDTGFIKVVRYDR